MEDTDGSFALSELRKTVSGPVIWGGWRGGHLHIPWPETNLTC